MEPPPFFPPPLSVHDFWVSEAKRGPQGYLASLLMPFHSTLFARLIVNSTHRLPELTCRMSRWWRKRSKAMGGWRVWPSEASPGASCCGTSDQDVATQNGACCSVAWAEAHKALCSSPTAACWAIWVEWQELSYLGNAESVCMCLRPLLGTGVGGWGGFRRLLVELNLISYLLCLCLYCSADMPTFTHLYVYKYMLLTSEYTGMSYQSKIWLLFFLNKNTDEPNGIWIWNDWQLRSCFVKKTCPILTDTS